MEPLTYAPAYVSIFPHLAEIARNHGYSLTVHGSVGKNRYSDLDLVAIPWIDEAKEAEVLMQAIWDWSVKMIINEDFAPLFKKEYYPEQKPHGRRAWFLQLGNGAGIDISVMPKATNEPSGGEG